MATTNAAATAEIVELDRACTRCGRVKPAAEFRKDTSKKTGRNTRCRSCERAVATSRLERNAQARIAAVSANIVLRCSVCGQNKSARDFAADKTARNGTSLRCQICAQNKHAEWRRKNQEHVRRKARESARRRRNPMLDRVVARRSRWFKTYGLDESAAIALWQAQGCACAICRRPLDLLAFDRQSHVDHDHRTGAVRGILCLKCNPGLGAFDDNITFLEAAIAYLKTHRRQP
jgi:hypothetical protein